MVEVCDKRIGEQDDGLGEFDKAILRSQRERQVRKFWRLGLCVGLLVVLVLYLIFFIG